MPCNDGGLVTRLLCDLTRKVPKKYLEGNSELETWVQQHAAADKARRDREAKEREEAKKALQQQIANLQKKFKQLEDSEE